MSVGVEALFTSALGLQLPWVVEDVKLDTNKRRIDFEIGCQRSTLTCRHAGKPGVQFACDVSATSLQVAVASAVDGGIKYLEPHLTERHFFSQRQACMAQL